MGYEYSEKLNVFGSFFKFANLTNLNWADTNLFQGVISLKSNFFKHETQTFVYYFSWYSFVETCILSDKKTLVQRHVLLTDNNRQSEKAGKMMVKNFV